MQFSCISSTWLRSDCQPKSVCRFKEVWTQVVKRQFKKLFISDFYRCISVQTLCSLRSDFKVVSVTKLLWLFLENRGLNTGKSSLSLFKHLQVGASIISMKGSG